MIPIPLRLSVPVAVKQLGSTPSVVRGSSGLVLRAAVTGWGGLHNSGKKNLIIPTTATRNNSNTPSRPFSTSSSWAKSNSRTVQELSAAEQKANRALKDPEAQADFYKALLTANYPHLVVSRFESPNVAKNTDAETYYVQALKLIGHLDKAEAVERAIEARSKGGKDALISSLPDGDAINYSYGGQQRSFLGKGTKTDPVHVIVTETAMGSLLKWLKWLIPMGLAAWGLIVGLSFFTESASILKGGSSEVSQNKMDGVNGSQSNVKFSDVHGVDEARNELEEIVDFLKDPSKFTGLGGKLPKGVLLTGPPGTGKTLLARAVAGEAGVPFFFMSGSEFDELYVGVGAKRVRELFAAARSKAPAIVFIDELDAIGSKRNPKDHAYSKQTLNQLLVDLDGFSQSTGVIFIAATNYPEMLDKALTRPGRFDKIVHVELPDVRGRIAILKHHMKKVETSPGVNPSFLARGTSGFSGADLMNLVNQAAIFASQQKAVSVDMSHFEWAKDKILLGAARKTMVLTEESRTNTAYHEAGHAIAAMYTPGATSLYKATILPRGSALGITFQLPDMDKYDQTKRELLARLDVAMGGKIAEEMTKGKDDVTSGCASDLKSATQIARAMVTSFGMGDKVGPVELSENWADWSADTRHLAEEEIRTLLVDSESRTRKLLEDKHEELERLAQGLLEYETLDKDEIEKVVNGATISKEKTTTNTVVKTEDIKDQRGDKVQGIKGGVKL